VRGLPAISVPYADETATPAEADPRHAEVLPAARIALVRFALAEVEQPAEDTPAPDAGRHQLHDVDHRPGDPRPSHW